MHQPERCCGNLQTVPPSTPAGQGHSWRIPVQIPAQQTLTESYCTLCTSPGLGLHVPEDCVQWDIAGIARGTLNLRYNILLSVQYAAPWWVTEGAAYCIVSNYKRKWHVLILRVQKYTNTVFRTEQNVFYFFECLILLENTTLKCRLMITLTEVNEKT